MVFLPALFTGSLTSPRTYPREEDHRDSATRHPSPLTTPTCSPTTPSLSLSSLTSLCVLRTNRAPMRFCHRSPSLPLPFDNRHHESHDPSRAHGVGTKVLDARDLGRRAPVFLRRVERRRRRSGGRPLFGRHRLGHATHRGRGPEVVRPPVTGATGVAEHRLGRGTPPPLGRVCG